MKNKKGVFFVWLCRADFICLTAGRCKMIALVVEMINVEYQMKNDKVFCRVAVQGELYLLGGR